ncbi:hypothetical protein BGX24_009273 [Mortierella sp. AD032]|nr:hypothetical protein BGX24_009273 [Mortierella sp. AD032]
MSDPVTHTTTSTTTATAKPTAMERVKEKASQLADKLSGRTHDNDVYHDSNQPGPAFHGNTANPIDPVATYHAGETPIDALNSGDTRPLGPAVPPKDDLSHHHHGIFGDHHDKHTQHHTTALAGANAPDPNVIHPSIVPHPQTIGGGVAGPTGTSHMPAYTTQSYAPTATTGTAAPIAAQTAEQGIYPPPAGAGTTGTTGLYGMENQGDLRNMNHVHAQTATMPTTTSAAGTQIPMNVNNSTVPVNQHNLPQMNPVHSTNNNTAANAANNGGIAPNVPAMGAPGTTTAAGTHMPGQYVA